MKKKRVVIYMRCSKYTGEKFKEKYTKLFGYVKTKPNWELVEIYYDNAPGKWTRCPQELQRLLDEAEQSRFDIVVIEKLETISAYSKKRIDISRSLEKNGVTLVTLFCAQREQRRAEKTRALLQYEMVEDALKRAECLTKEQFISQSKENTKAFMEYIDESFEEILHSEEELPNKKIIGIHVGNKVCCIPLTSRSLLVLRDSIEILQRSIE